MKTFPLYLAIALGALLLALPLHSQPPQEPRTPVQALQAIKAQNEQHLKKQAEMIAKLDELQKQAQQIKFLSARG
ncbi:MAG: hypothetical protein M3463_11145 [Verrucomicrobiota bacterium]|nr:hypothetical protein [Verrucomicrobiota bacterium]